eukprot:TRINITY_DN9861_c0_g1_i1.p1 TRINITY_DN9861_c0_g1~~TRINITY_DN9861_c0_g1_i1.p1  ORF type:complete len:546 (-),score=89.98 TRINITY_DN9861_c0_g1_i1:134-1771(-)
MSVRWQALSFPIKDGIPFGLWEAGLQVLCNCSLIDEEMFKKACEDAKKNSKYTFPNLNTLSPLTIEDDSRTIDVNYLLVNFFQHVQEYYDLDSSFPEVNRSLLNVLISTKTTNPLLYPENDLAIFFFYVIHSVISQKRFVSSNLNRLFKLGHQPLSQEAVFAFLEKEQLDKRLVSNVINPNQSPSVGNHWHDFDEQTTLLLEENFLLRKANSKITIKETTYHLNIPRMELTENKHPELPIQVRRLIDCSPVQYLFVPQPLYFLFQPISTTRVAIIESQQQNYDCVILPWPLSVPKLLEQLNVSADFETRAKALVIAASGGGILQPVFCKTGSDRAPMALVVPYREKAIYDDVNDPYQKKRKGPKYQDPQSIYNEENKHNNAANQTGGQSKGFHIFGRKIALSSASFDKEKEEREKKDRNPLSYSSNDVKLSLSTEYIHEILNPSTSLEFQDYTRMMKSGMYSLVKTAMRLLKEFNQRDSTSKGADEGGNVKKISRVLLPLFSKEDLEMKGAALSYSEYLTLSGDIMATLLPYPRDKLKFFMNPQL